MTAAGLIQIGIPSDLVEELMGEGILEKAVAIQNLSEITAVTVDVITSESATVTLVGGVVTFKRIAEALVAKIGDRQGERRARMTIFHQGDAYTFDLVRDAKGAVSQVEGLLLVTQEPPDTEGE